MIKKLSIALATMAFATTAATAVTTVTVEAPGVTNTTTVVTNGGVETFNGLANGVQGLTTTYGGSPVTGTYTTFLVNPADQYGGANNSKYAAVTTTTTLTFSGAPVNYFGLYVSGADAGNVISIFSGSTLVYTNDFATIGAGLAPGYFGNPGAPFTGQNPTEPYAFYNFFTTTPFTSIVLTNANNGGLFESDNHTVGTASAVPEPASWALIVVGFAMVGLSTRRRSRYAAA